MCLGKAAFTPKMSETFVDLNLSRDRLFGHCSPHHAWVADHVSHQSDITMNAANYTTQHHTLSHVSYVRPPRCTTAMASDAVPDLV